MRRKLCLCHDRLYSHNLDPLSGRCRRGWGRDKDGDWYQLGEPGEACECAGYQEAPLERQRRGRMAVKAGAKAERRVAAVTGERKRGGPGNADNGRNETKVMTKQIRGHVAEARAHGGEIVRYVDGRDVWELRRL